MTVQNLIRSRDLPYHVTARVNNREIFPCTLEQVWEIFTKLCFEFTLLGRLKIHAFVLMANHFHLIATTPSADLDEVMRDFMRSATRSLQLVSGRSGHIFGGPYRKSLVDSTNYFAHALKYVYRNPVKAGHCEKVEDYAFSTLPGMLGRAPLPFPLFYPFELGGLYQIPDESSVQFLDWLNRPFPNEQDETIRKALRKRSINRTKGTWKERFALLDSALPEK